MGCDSQFDRGCCGTSMMGPHDINCPQLRPDSSKLVRQAEPKLSGPYVQWLVQVFNPYNHQWDADKHQTAPYRPLTDASFRFLPDAQSHMKLSREKWPSDRYRIMKISREVVLED